ncbi:MAG: hypothetical protein MK082_12855, partial [Phycisphaerales bacterium]|nr:hypothetical protein [Phycisphaerales bacterium]
MRTRMMSTLFLASVTGLLTSGLHADVLEVAADGSQEYLTIESALSVAMTGDTVLVHPGTYVESGLATGGRSIAIQSVAGADQTTIDG